MMRTLAGLVAIAAIAVAPRVARGAGFELGEESAAATGMVGAFVAKADDPSALFYNPAGLAKLRGPQVYVGGMLIVGRVQAKSTPDFTLAGSPQDADTTTVFIPNLYASWGFAHDVAVGLGAFTNFGLQATWPNWAGRYESTYARLESITLNPSVAWRPVSWFSFGAGFDVTFGRVDLRRDENLVTSDANIRFNGNAVGFGGNVGVLFEIPRKGKMPPLSIGASYRSRYNMNFDQGALFVTAPPEFSSTLHSANASASLAIPDVVLVGVGVRPLDPLFLQVQFDWSNWSRLQSLQLNVPSDPALNLTIPESWHDGYTLRVGGEYVFGKWTARAGVGYDWSPAPANTLSPTIPDSSRWLVSAGTAVNLPSGFVLEASMMGVIFNSRRSELPELPVEYSSYALLFSVGASYRTNRVAVTY